MRIGTGYDAHRLTPGRPLILGGVTIPSDVGLDGHSDADAVAHAVVDALLGAAALGDIGTYFPSSDPQWKGASSMRFLESTARLLAERGWRIVNVDATILAQKARLSPHYNAMRHAMAQALGVDVSCVSVKATTTDGLSFVGRNEGIAAQAVALIEERR
ncbi:MAG: 2-C-methyl-D-erythritol 2,4-cyclodiphosphate synthase [Chloroflexi bacterium]|nr:2-C-methyl-D-erythritol 2,4-cyclodiphosphate synthase [Chloroflexota bacterium]